MDRQRRRRCVGVAVLERVGEDVVDAAGRAGVAGVAVLSAGIDGQRAVLAVDDGAAVDVESGAADIVALDVADAGAVGALGVGTRRAGGRAGAGDDVAGLGRELAGRDAVGVGMRDRRVVDDGDGQVAAAEGRVAVLVGDADRDADGGVVGVSPVLSSSV
nr:hypothetical protein [Mesorhizobium sp. B4-1-4]